MCVTPCDIAASMAALATCSISFDSHNIEASTTTLDKDNTP